MSEMESENLTERFDGVAFFNNRVNKIHFHAGESVRKIINLSCFNKNTQFSWALVLQKAYYIFS